MGCLSSKVDSKVSPGPGSSPPSPGKEALYGKSRDVEDRAQAGTIRFADHSTDIEFETDEDNRNPDFVDPSSRKEGYEGRKFRKTGYFDGLIPHAGDTDADEADLDADGNVVGFHGDVRYAEGRKYRKTCPAPPPDMPWEDLEDSEEGEAREKADADTSKRGTKVAKKRGTKAAKVKKDGEFPAETAKRRTKAGGKRSKTMNV